MRFQAAIFDLFGTLVPPFPNSLYYQYLNSIAVALELDPERFKKKWCHDSWHARATGAHDTTEAELHHIAMALEVEPSEVQLAEAGSLRRAFTRESLTPRPDAVESLIALKSAGLRLGLISDCTVEVPELWPDTPFAGLFDTLIFSCSVGLKKPDPRIYQLACSELNLSPRDCLYIGDGSSRELSGAAALGMYAILIKPPGELPDDWSETESSSWTGPRIERLSDVLTMIPDS